MNLIKQLEKLAEKCKADRFGIEPTPDNIIQRIKLEAIEETASGIAAALPELEKKARETGFNKSDEQKNKRSYAVRRAYAQWLLDNHNDRRFSVNDWNLYPDIRDAYILAEESALAEVPQ